MKPLIAVLLVVIAVIGSLKVLSPQKPSVQGTVTNANTPDIIYYWGEGCSHCESLKKYILENKIEERFQITYKEVWGNQDNLNDLKETAKLCPDIDLSQGIGVPFVFFTADKKCVVGDSPVIEKIEQMIK